MNFKNICVVILLHLWIIKTKPIKPFFPHLFKENIKIYQIWNFNIKNTIN